MNAPTRPTLAIINGHVTTTSSQIAEHFGKEHKLVLRAIRNLACSPDFRQRNFAPASIEVEQPNGGMANYPAYTITRDGFVFLAMGFTGKEAAQWKEAYIEAFNAMESALKAAPPAVENTASYLTRQQIGDAGLNGGETTVVQSVVLAVNMLRTSFNLYLPARVALYTAVLSLLVNACELLKLERSRICREMEGADGSEMGGSTLWPDVRYLGLKEDRPPRVPRIKPDNGKEYTPPAVKLDNGREYAPCAAVEGGAA